MGGLTPHTVKAWEVHEFEQSSDVHAERDMTATDITEREMEGVLTLTSERI